MKKLCLLLVAICLLTLCACKKETPAKTVYLLESETESMYIREAKVYVDLSKIQYTYSEAGIPQKIMTKRSNEETSAELECDAQGNILRRTVRDGKGRITEDYRYTYDVSGNPLTEEKSNNLRQIHTATWTYDAQGRVLTYSVVNHISASNNRKTEYSYDPEKKCNKISEYAADALTSCTLEQLDDTGRVTVSTRYDADGNEELHLEYSYEGKTVTVKQYWEGTLSSTVVKNHDDNGNLISEEYYDTKETQPIRKIIYTYKAFQIPTQ